MGKENENCLVCVPVPPGSPIGAIVMSRGDCVVLRSLKAGMAT